MNETPTTKDFIDAREEAGKAIYRAACMAAGIGFGIRWSVLSEEGRERWRLLAERSSSKRKICK